MVANVSPISVSSWPRSSSRQRSGALMSANSWVRSDAGYGRDSASSQRATRVIDVDEDRVDAVHAGAGDQAEIERHVQDP